MVIYSFHVTVHTYMPVKFTKFVLNTNVVSNQIEYAHYNVHTYTCKQMSSEYECNVLNYTQKPL